MDDFDFLDRDFNIGGLALIEFIPIDNISSMAEPDPGENVVTTPVLTGVSDFVKMYATIDTMRLNYPQESTAHGEKFNLTVKGFIPKLQQPTDLNLDSLKNQQLIVKCTDENGKVRICGTVESPMSFRFSSDTGEKKSDRNGADVVFYGESDHAPFYVEE